MPFTFEPMFVYAPIIKDQTPLQHRNFIATKYITTSPQEIVIGTYSVYIYFKDTNRTELRLYSTSSANNQFNNQSIIYTYLGIGGYDYGNGAPVEPPLTTTEWLIKYSDGSSGTWTVPRSGYYQLELYGGGGGYAQMNDATASGGASCQTYDSIYFKIGENFLYSIGGGGKGQTETRSSSTSYYTGGTGGKTIFGDYTVNGRTGRVVKATVSYEVVCTAYSAGKKAGNKGKDGALNSGSLVYGTGTYSSMFGYGGAYLAGSAGNGGIYIKYLHD